MLAQCLEEDLAFELATGLLAGPEAKAAHEHVDSCEKCRKWVGALARAEAPSVAVTESPSEAPTLPAANPAAQFTLMPGQSLGQYEVRGHIGSGGMSLVYAAFDRQLGRSVALKVLRPGRHGVNKARLLREARAMARLSHVNVLPVYEARELDGVVFLALELVEGTTLGRWLKAERRPWAQVLDVFRAAAEGLGAAHAAGIVHRDFKPENVLIGNDGRVRVTDFGLARWVEKNELSSDGSLTQSGTFVGTPVYMSPEHVAGEVDARSDQFSFCVSLYEGLYGSRPFAGANVRELSEVMLKRQMLRPVSGRSVPGWLRRVVLKGLSPLPKDRFASMRALLEALVVGERTHRRVQRAAAVLVAVLAVAGAVWGSQVSLMRESFVPPAIVLPVVAVVEAPVVEPEPVQVPVAVPVRAAPVVAKPKRVIAVDANSPYGG